nr:hypothetical protein [Candidatus Freyarchaeota archaeon]
MQSEQQMFERRVVPPSDLEPNKFNANVMEDAEYQAMRLDVREGRYDDVIVSPKDVFYGDPSLPHDKFVICDGFNRWRAVNDEKLPGIKIEIRPMTEEEARVYGYRKNVLRGHMDPFKVAELWKWESDRGMKYKDIAARYGVDKSTVSETISLLDLNPEVVKFYHDPVKTLEEKQEQRYQEVKKDYEKEHAEWQEAIDKAKEQGLSKRKIEELDNEEPYEPEKLPFKAPEGKIDLSKLKMLAVLPKESQVKVVERIVSRNLNARETEEQVQIEKRNVKEKEKLDKFLETAKTSNCPKCGKRAVALVNRRGSEIEVKCENYDFWNPNLTKEEILTKEKKEEEEEEAEEDEEETEEEAKEEQKQKRINYAEQKKQREERERLRYFGLKETPNEAYEQLIPWVKKRAQRMFSELTVIDHVEIKGRRGTEGVSLEFDVMLNEDENGKLTLDDIDVEYEVEEKPDEVNSPSKEIDFNISENSEEAKEIGIKSRVRMDMEPTEENRKTIETFLKETIYTDQEPPWPIQPKTELTPEDKKVVEAIAQIAEATPNSSDKQQEVEKEKAVQTTVNDLNGLSEQQQPKSPGEEKKSEEAKLTEGWGYPAGSKKAHYFVSGMSACGKYGFYRGELLEQGSEEVSCKVCWNAVMKLKDQKAAEE